MIIYSPNPTFVPSLSKIGDLSCIASCLVLPGFLMDTLLIKTFLSRYLATKWKESGRHFITKLGTQCETSERKNSQDVFFAYLTNVAYVTRVDTIARLTRRTECSVACNALYDAFNCQFSDARESFEARQKINRGHFLPACGYEFYFRELNRRHLTSSLRSLVR